MQFRPRLRLPLFSSTIRPPWSACSRTPTCLVYEKKISNIKELGGRCSKRSSTRAKPLLIIAEDVDGEALATLVINPASGGNVSSAVRSQGRPRLYGEPSQGPWMEDISILTGGTPIFESLGIKLENLPLTDLGRAKRK